MKVLTAAVGSGLDDFANTLLGEIVCLTPVCATDDPKREGRGTCGCGRAFTGLTSRVGTTVAKIVDLELDLQTLAAMVGDCLRASGWDMTPELAMDAAEEIAELAGDFDEGTLLRRLIDEVSAE